MKSKLLILTGILFVAPMIADPGFSLHNKSKSTIFVTVENNVSTFKKVANFFSTEANTVLKDGFLDKNIDLSKKTVITLYDKNGKEYYKAEIPANTNKTVYINWDGTKFYHQRGPVWGITSKTDQGYSTKNNIKDEQIRVLKV